jgi:hypothetical protein
VQRADLLDDFILIIYKTSVRRTGRERREQASAPSVGLHKLNPIRVESCAQADRTPYNDRLAIFTSPHQEYAQRLEARRASLAVWENRHRSIGTLRPLVFFAGVAGAFVVFSSRNFSVWWLLAPVAVFCWLSARIQCIDNKRTSFSRAVGFYERAMLRMHGDWAGNGQTGERFLENNHLYAKDLDIFGRGSLFELLCNARTPMGHQVLAAWLLNPATPDVVRARQDAVTELASRLDLREDIAVLAENARAGLSAERLCAWGEREPLIKPSRFPSAALGLSVLGATAVVALIAYLMVYLEVFFQMLELREKTIPGLPLYFQPPEKIMTGLQIYFLFVGIVYAGILWRLKRRTTQIISEIADVAPDLSVIAGVLQRFEIEQSTSARLAMLRAELDIDGWPPSKRIAKLNRLVQFVDSRRNIAMVAIRPLLLLDLHLSYAIEDWRRAYGPATRRWLNAVGEMETILSIAGYHYEHPEDVFPKLIADQPHFDGKGLGHPFLPDDRVVRNDVYLNRDQSVLVVSGSNMSGKSTMLRTIGINTVLAQIGAPVRARQLTLSSLVVGASIRIQDSLQDNTSRFYAEITRLRQIMEKAGGSTPVLFLVDEILHGTNSHDRRVGAEAIVRGLLARGAIGLLTTHDLALAHVADILSPRGANVHFEDYMENGEIHFDYRMRPGVVQNSNAIELMRSIGLVV